MVSKAKRMRYVSENEEFSSSDGDNYNYEETDYSLRNRRKSSDNDGRSTSLSSKSSQPNKWLSRNAIMARENRRKKKMYINNLESDVNKLKSDNENYSKVIDNQSMLIQDLRKEIKYLKSVLANSTDIGNLIKNIRQSTGMSVQTSLDQTLSHVSIVSKQCPKKQHIARKTPHPWEENEFQYPSYPTPESDLFSNNAGDLSDFVLSSDDLQLDNLLDVPLLPSLDVNDAQECLNEHNYTTPNEEDLDNDVGVCLHVSKHRVSLEFCSSCSENASEAWIK